MNTFSLTAIFIIAILASKAQRIQNRAISCGASSIPGINVFEQGVDVTEFNLYNCPSPKGLKYKLFDLDDCSDGQRWFFELANRTFSVPNTFKLYMQSKDVNEKGDLLTTKDEIRVKFAETVDIDEFHGDIFSKSDAFIKLQKELVSKSIVIAKNHYEFYSIEVDDLRKTNQVNNDLMNSIKSLPPDFNRSPVAYINLIKKYGTHYIKSGVFGGAVQRITAIEKSELKDSNRAREIGNKNFPDFLPFEHNRGICYDRNRNYIANFANFETQYGFAWFEQLFLGGESDLIWTGGGYEGWVLSIPERVHLIKVRLEPISSLVSGNQRQQLESAIRVYIAHGKLHESIRDLEIHIKNQTIITNAPSLSAEELLRDAENMKQEDNYDIKKIREMIQDIKDEINNERKLLPVQDKSTSTTSTSTTTTSTTTTTTTTTTTSTSTSSPPTVSTIAVTQSTSTSTAPPPQPEQNEVRDGKSSSVTITTNYIVCLLFILNSITLLNYLK